MLLKENCNSSVKQKFYSFQLKLQVLMFLLMCRLDATTYNFKTNYLCCNYSPYTLQGTGNTLLANHQEVGQHEDGNQPRQYEGVSAVVAGQGGLSNACTTTQ